MVRPRQFFPGSPALWSKLAFESGAYVRASVSMRTTTYCLGNLYRSIVVCAVSECFAAKGRTIAEEFEALLEGQSTRRKRTRFPSADDQGLVQVHTMPLERPVMPHGGGEGRQGGPAGARHSRAPQERRFLVAGGARS